MKQLCKSLKAYGYEVNNNELLMIVSILLKVCKILLMKFSNLDKIINE